MANVNGEILIERPVEEVFDFVADQRNEPIYNPRMQQSEKITDGPIGVGTRFERRQGQGGEGSKCSSRSRSSRGPAGSAHAPRCPLSMLMAD
jgi:hypothetical protein